MSTLDNEEVAKLVLRTRFGERAIVICIPTSARVVKAALG